MKKMIVALTLCSFCLVATSSVSAQPTSNEDAVKTLSRSFSEADVFYNVDTEKDYNAKAFTDGDADGTVKCWRWYYRPVRRVFTWRPRYYRPYYCYYRYYVRPYRVYFRWTTYTVYKGLSKSADTGNGAVLDADPTPDSPFAAHGLRKGDMITAIDGKPVANLADLNAVAADSKLSVIKGDKVKFAGNLLKEGDEEFMKSFDGLQEVEAGTLLTKGEIKDGNFDMYKLYEKESDPAFGVKAAANDGDGVKVTEVVANLPGRKSGFEVGDVILEINGTKIGDEQAYSDAIDRAGKVARMKVRCGKTGNSLDVDVILNK